MKDKPKIPIVGESITEQYPQLKALEEIIDRGDSFVMVWRIEPGTWPIEFVSDNVESILGYSVDDFLSGRVSWPGITHQDDVPRLEKEVARYLEKGDRRWSQEYRLMTKSGEVKWFRDNSLAFADNAGRITGIQAVIHDITRHKETEEALRQSESKCSTIVEQATDGVSIIQDKVIKFANKRMAEMSGYTVEELTGMSTFDLVPPDFAPVLAERFALRAQGADVLETFSTQLLCKDGTVKEMESSTSLIRYEGRPAAIAIIRDITERKFLEEKLRREEQRFHALVEHSSDIIVLVDRNGAVIYENPAIEQILGFKRGKRIGASVFEFVHPDDSKIVADAFNILKNYPDAPIQRSEIRVRHKDDSWHTFQATGSNLVQGNVVESVIINLRDITERKRVEHEIQKHREHLEELVAERTKELRESEEKFRIIFNSIADGISVIDLATGKLIDSNPAALHMFNFTREDIIGRYSYELIAERDRQRAMEDIVHTIAAGNSNVAEWCMLGKDGTEHECEARASVICDLSGKPLYLVNVMRDIGERKCINESIKESERRYRILAENVSDVILTLDMNLQLTYISPSGYRMPSFKGLNIQTDQGAENTSAQDLVTPESFQIITGVLKEELAVENSGKENLFRSRKIEIQMMSKDEPAAFVEVTASFIRDHEGHATGILCILRDITQLRKDEKIRAELERNYQLNSRLASIGKMATGLAHEINNPLSSIVGLAELLLKENLTEAVKADLRIICDCANQAADITKRLLIFAGQVKPIRTLCNINNIIANTVHLMDYHLKTNNIVVVVELDPEQPETMVDSAQLQQVMLNLILNAEDEMKRYRGRGKLLVQTKIVGDMLRIVVSDDGPGIPKEMMDKIFEPFFTTKKTGEGTGLGLAICHGIMSEHNGRIYAKSEAGKGATFIVELPMIRQEEGEEVEPHISPKPLIQRTE
jgi:two-component system NtrC family sensor kinase